MDVDRKPCFELRRVWNDGHEDARFCTLEEFARESGTVHMGRRGLLKMASLAGISLAAVSCSTTMPATEPTPTQTYPAKPTSTSTQTPSPIVTVTPTPTNTITPTKPPPTPTPAYVTLESCADIFAHAGSAGSVTFSPDGTWLVSGGSEMKIWETASHQPVKVIKAAHGSYHRVNFSPDGLLLAAANSYGFLTVWDTRNWEELYQIPTSGNVRSLEFTADGQVLSTLDDNLRTLEARTGTVLKSWFNSEDFINTASISPEGTWTAVDGVIYSIPDLEWKSFTRLPGWMPSRTASAAAAERDLA